MWLTSTYFAALVVPVGGTLRVTVTTLVGKRVVRVRVANETFVVGSSIARFAVIITL